jgi:hypothetical protein
VFTAKDILFILEKKYLTEEQQKDIRRFAAMQ